MRAAFVRTLVELAERDDRIALLTGDLGFMVLEPFAERFPERFFNVGVAEQNMVGIATGLAESGFVPFVYSIATFASMRPYEFIRNGPILHQLPVRIVGVGGGFDYGSNGTTHYALEDIALMRAQPGMRIVVPADDEHASAALSATWNLPGPAYYRVAKDARGAVKGLDGRFETGRPQILRKGDDALIVTMGTMAAEALQAAEKLAAAGAAVGVLLVDQFGVPGLEHAVADELRGHELVVSAESHYVNGGLGSFLAEIIAESGSAARLVRCGIRETPIGITGSAAYMNEKHGISAGAIARAVLEALRSKETAR